MQTKPFSYGIVNEARLLSDYDNHIERRLSQMRGYYQDTAAYEARLAADDTLLYDVYEIQRPGVEGEMMHGLSVLHPGKVGDEYHMTKGHFHEVLETGEVYYCLRGQGVMVMETPEGDWAIEPLTPGNVLYVPPRWAHRSVNTGADDDLVTFFVYPANAGHDYRTIAERGFRKIVVDEGGAPVYRDNPRWQGNLP